MSDLSNSKIDYLTINDSKLVDPQILSNHFNTFFANVGKDLASTLPRSHTDPPLSYLSHSSHIEFLPTVISSLEVLAIIKTIKVSTPGYDNIHIKIFKKVASVLAPVLSQMINKSFQTGIFP